MLSKIDLGRRGEGLAVRLLVQKGYRIAERNVRFRMGEIDLVAYDGSTLCFVEVRTTSSTRRGLPEESVTFQKRRRLCRLAQRYLQSRRFNEIPVRFDVLSILMAADGAPARTRLIKGAFEAA